MFPYDNADVSPLHGWAEIVFLILFLPCLGLGVAFVVRTLRKPRD
ncbi:MAG TPA: hypothetical protein VEL03_03920 [Streptosporangiaceae bacterium]|nr:hypothetical protein [Streptosporangiaceae bacterium]